MSASAPPLRPLRLCGEETLKAVGTSKRETLKRVTLENHRTNNMKRSRLVLLIIIAVAVLSHRSDGQQPRSISEQLRLASVMPGGAMLYIQARDLSALMKTWLASPVRGRFYKSPSFTAFERSRIYLKLQARQKDFGTALGFGINEERLAELAGGASSVGIMISGSWNSSSSAKSRANALLLPCYSRMLQSFRNVLGTVSLTTFGTSPPTAAA